MKENKELNNIAWALYRSSFTDGQQVVVENDDGDFLWGELETTKTGIKLKRIEGKKDVYLKWNEITFIANDGFPVRAINGMSYEEAVKFCWNLPTATFRNIMDALSDMQEDEAKPKITEKKTEPPKRVTFGGGCPFVFEDVSVKALHFPGNNGPEWWGSNEEETLVLESRDGAIMHSFDMSHLFLFDGLTLPYVNELYEPDNVSIW